MTPPDAASVDRFRRDALAVATRALDDAAPTGAFTWSLAVSGGPDSMAILALAAAAFPGHVRAATVDHGLRDASAAEAATVAHVCTAMGVPHATLHPAAPIAGASLQARAREARYAALLAWEGGHGALLTAHHADDQAETLLMRLNRSSGLAGLSAIRAARWEGGRLILRPLLAWRRAELRAVVACCGLPHVDDPANADPRHERTRARALLAGAPGLDPAALAASAGFLAEAEDVIARATELLWSERWSGPERPFDVAREPRELRRRLLRRAILDTRERLTILLPRFTLADNVEPLLDALEQGRRAVQGGVMVTPDAVGWRFAAAPPRNERR